MAKERSKEPIPYKDTLAHHSSRLHELLSEGKMKEAEAQYQETRQRERDLMASIDARFGNKPAVSVDANSNLTQGNNNVE